MLEQYIFLTIFIYYFLKIEKAICGTENYKIAMLTLRPWFCFKWRIKKNAVLEKKISSSNITQL